MKIKLTNGFAKLSGKAIIFIVHFEMFKFIDFL